MRFYLFRGLRLWGDYGAILIHGMSRHLGRNEDGFLQLERTGPFIPPITFPGLGNMIVTDEIRRKFESAGLAKLGFTPVVKARIVDYPWEQWDLTSEKPAEYPEGGEPEAYILGRPHAPACAEQLENLWEVILPEDAHASSQVITKRPRVVENRVDPSTWSGSHLFRAKGKPHVWVTEVGKHWLEANAAGWVEFEEASTEARTIFTLTLRKPDGAPIAQGQSQPGESWKDALSRLYSAATGGGEAHLNPLVPFAQDASERGQGRGIANLVITRRDEVRVETDPPQF